MTKLHDIINKIILEDCKKIISKDLFILEIETLIRERSIDFASYISIERKGFEPATPEAWEWVYNEYFKTYFSEPTAR